MQKASAGQTLGSHGKKPSGRRGRTAVSDYDWCCPSCGNRISWNDEGAYSDRIDDTVCLECAMTEDETSSTIPIELSAA
jgi:hypothetical protein